MLDAAASSDGSVAGVGDKGDCEVMGCDLWYQGRKGLRRSRDMAEALIKPAKSVWLLSDVR